MSEYVVSGLSLTSVADAIRAKGGTSENLSFPTGFVSAIEAIPSGGGGGGSSNVEEGSYTPSADVAASSVSIQHSLGVAPDFIIAYAEDEIESVAEETKQYITNSFFTKTNISATNVTTGAYMHYLATWPGRTTANQGIDYISPTKFADSSSFKIPYYSSSNLLKSGVTYRYILGVYASD